MCEDSLDYIVNSDQHQLHYVIISDTAQQKGKKCNKTVKAKIHGGCDKTRSETDPCHQLLYIFLESMRRATVCTIRDKTFQEC